MTLELGNIAFDQLKLFRHFRNDLKDDWFPDPLAFKDMIEGGIIENALKANFDANHGIYVPSKVNIYNIPKPNHTLRYGIEFGVADRVLYHGLSSYLVPHFDPLLPWFVFSHRGALPNNDRYLFRRGIQSWKDFIGAVRSALTPEKYLLSTDLSNYFEHIDIEKLQATFLECLPELNVSANEKGQIRTYIETLFSCLKNWSFNGRTGLPQNRDASSFLANMYLLPVDRIMNGLGYTCFRYMDDIKIVCDNQYEARHALKHLILALRERGLSVNSKKTILCEGTDTEKVSQSLDSGTPEIERLDSLWSTRSETIIRQTFIDIRNLTLSLLNSNKVDSREFRYCINRLTLLAGCQEFAVPKEYFDPITDLILEKIPLHPAATDQFTKYLRAVPVTEHHLKRVFDHIANDERNFYSWQNYRLWFLLGQKAYAASEAVGLATKIITTCEDDATRAGATVYGGAIGNASQREVIAERFSSLSSFLGQRSAIVATHEVPFKNKVSTFVRPHVRPDLQNVYRSMRSNPGLYFLPPETVSITRIIDVERDYD